MQKSLPYLWPKWRQNSQNWFPIYDQNGWKTLPFGAAHTYIAHIREYPPPGLRIPLRITLWKLSHIIDFYCRSVLCNCQLLIGRKFCADRIQNHYLLCLLLFFANSIFFQPCGNSWARNENRWPYQWQDLTHWIWVLNGGNQGFTSASYTGKNHC